MIELFFTIGECYTLQTYGSEHEQKWRGSLIAMDEAGIILDAGPVMADNQVNDSRPIFFPLSSIVFVERAPKWARE